MTPLELKYRCKKIGLTTHASISMAMNRKNRNTARRWLSGQTPIPHWVDAQLKELERENKNDTHQ